MFKGEVLISDKILNDNHMDVYRRESAKQLESLLNNLEKINYSMNTFND